MPDSWILGWLIGFAMGVATTLVMSALIVGGRSDEASEQERRKHE